MGWSMSFIDANQAKSTAMSLTTRYINILVQMDRKGLWDVLIPMSNPDQNPGKEQLRKIRRKMLKEFYTFIISDRVHEFEERCIALDSVISHLECAAALDASKVSPEVWSTPMVLIKEAYFLLEDIKTLNGVK